jgi:predicted transposase YbfD/YdcC
LAEYLPSERKAHYLFTVKGNQPQLLDDIQLFFQDRDPDKPHHVLQSPKAKHGRIETRKIWTTTELNDYLNFPHVGQAFLIERHSIVKKTGKVSLDVAYGITSRSPQQATPERVLMVNRGHWTIENSCHSIIDWNYGEDRGRISTGFGPENMSRLRRFAVGLIKSKQVRSVPGKMREFTRNVRLVFDLVRMTKNSCIQPVRS